MQTRVMTNNTFPKTFNNPKTTEKYIPSPKKHKIKTIISTFLTPQPSPLHGTEALEPSPGLVDAPPLPAHPRVAGLPDLLAVPPGEPGWADAVVPDHGQSLLAGTSVEARVGGAGVARGDAVGFGFAEEVVDHFARLVVADAAWNKEIFGN